MTRKSSRPPSLAFRSRLLRSIAIGLTVAALAAAFAYVGGWLAPKRLAPATIIDGFEAGGVHTGYRRNHAKGICVIGEFESSGDAAALSHASVFEPEQSVPVIGRLAMPGPNPAVADTMIPIRSFALQFSLPDNEQWRTGMNAMPVFAVATPQAFWEQMQSSRPDPQTGKPDPEKTAAFYEQHPETAPFLEWVADAQPSSSYVNLTYNSINAFRFIDADGQTHFVRWSLEPEAPFTPITEAQLEDPNFLDPELRQRLSEGPQRWHLMITVAEPGDPTDDATKAWPEDRQRVDAGVLVINSAQAQDDGACRDINYDPLILPDGIAGSDDPLLSARSAAYSESFNRRIREQAESPTNPDQEPQS
ncbi:MAG: catalase family peroxidase [Halomonas sp.]|uniref:catalase family peroxidase n=1 Tax=Halomonas sp. TaxID=1486246 RepID=UPI003F91F713